MSKAIEITKPLFEYFRNGACRVSHYLNDGQIEFDFTVDSSLNITDSVFKYDSAPYLAQKEFINSNRNLFSKAKAH